MKNSPSGQQTTAEQGPVVKGACTGKNAPAPVFPLCSPSLDELGEPVPKMQKLGAAHSYTPLGGLSPEGRSEPGTPIPEWGKEGILRTPCSPMRKVWLGCIQPTLAHLRYAEFQLRPRGSQSSFLPVTPHLHATNSAQTPNEDSFVNVIPQ